MTHLFVAEVNAEDLKNKDFEPTYHDREYNDGDMEITHILDLKRPVHILFSRTEDAGAPLGRGDIIDVNNYAAHAHIAIPLSWPALYLTVIKQEKRHLVCVHASIVPPTKMLGDHDRISATGFKAYTLVVIGV